MYISIRFVLWLTWIDSRLLYENLDEDYYRNRLSKENAARLWTPTIILKNSLEGKNLQFDPSNTNLFLGRLGNSSQAPLNQAYEAKMYSANETNIIWRSGHLLKFKCQFDLFYLPLDNQTCFIQVSSSAKLIMQNQFFFNFGCDFNRWKSLKQTDSKSN